MSEKLPERAPEELRHEYSEVNQNFRHYSALRFAILTVYFAVVGGLASVAFGIVKASPGVVTLLAKASGLITTLAFFAFEIILERFLVHFSKVATQLEKALGYTQLSTKPRSSVLRTRNATWTLFILLIVFWIYALIWM